MYWALRFIERKRNEINQKGEYRQTRKGKTELMDIKHTKKVQLAKYIKEHNNIDIDPNSIFDIQIKRLHEYKRQLLNVFHIIYPIVLIHFLKSIKGVMTLVGT